MILFNSRAAALFRRLHRPRTAFVLLVASLALVLGSCDDSVQTYQSRFADFESGSNEVLIVPVIPPPGYALSAALDARTWVPTEFKSGQVPSVTLCTLAEGVDPEGVCFGTEDGDSVAVEEGIIDGNRLVIVALPGEGFTAAKMLDGWHGRAFTSGWDDLGWLGEDSARSR